MKDSAFLPERDDHQGNYGEADMRMQLITELRSLKRPEPRHERRHKAMPTGYDGYGAHCGQEVIPSQDLPLANSRSFFGDTLSARMDHKNHITPPTDLKSSVTTLFNKYAKMGEMCALDNRPLHTVHHPSLQ